MNDIWPAEPVDSERLRLRPAQQADLAELLDVNGDDETTRFLPYPSWRDLDDAQAWWLRMQSLLATGAARQLVIVQRAQDRVIGSLLLFRYERPSARLELGYVLGRPWWRQGYAREALGLALDRLFRDGAIRRIEAEVNPRNIPSGRLLRSLGFRHEGLLRERWVAKGQAYDVEVFGLLAPEWRAGA